MTSGVIHTDTVLDRILKQTAIDVSLRRETTPDSVLEDFVAGMDQQPLSLATAIDTSTVGVIAEFKRGSPSRGVFPVEIEPVSVAESYCEGGAVAISCLTDGPFFHGSADDLKAVASVAHGEGRNVAVLRKDFTVDRYQLLEARAWGADVVLLIVAALDDALLASLNAEAIELGLSVLVEVHNEAELERAMRLEPAIIGVNNRDLHTFKVDLGTTKRIADQMPDGVLLVSESGIFTREHVEEVASCGAAAVLVGESLILQDDRVAAVREIDGVARRTRGDA